MHPNGSCRTLRSADCRRLTSRGCLFPQTPATGPPGEARAIGGLACPGNVRSDPAKDLSSGGRVSAAGFDPGFLTGGRDDALGKADAPPGDCASRIEAMLSAPADPKADPAITCRALP